MLSELLSEGIAHEVDYAGNLEVAEADEEAVDAPGVGDAEVEHRAHRLPARAGDACVLGDGEPELPPLEVHEARPLRARCEPEHVPVEAQHRLEVARPEHHAGDALDVAGRAGRPRSARGHPAVPRG